VEFLPQGRSGRTDSPGTPATAWRAWRRAIVLASAATLASFALPTGTGSADPAGTPSGLQATVAAANQLSNEIDVLGQQYDALRIQQAEARTESEIARETARRDQRALGAGQAAVAQIAAQGYMDDGVSPALLLLLQTTDPQQFLNRASIILELSHEQGGTVNLLAEAEGAANRATQTANQEEFLATRLSAAMNKKVAEIQAKENVLNSSAYAQALAIFQRTGTYPQVAVTGDTLGAQAVRFALSKLGAAYVWGGGGPDVFDCSGLVMWAYAQVGISLPHYTGDQWNAGEHVSRSQLQPGDIVFFFGDISHEGMYIGNNLMVDAPSAGQVVRIDPIWGAYVGAVRIL
jgi:cell wall-associated NlpC family hydrolase